MKIECKLCGLPTPNPPVLSGDHKFCCHGCQTVYQFFGESVLDAERDYKQKESDLVTTGSEAFLRIDGMHCASCEIMMRKLGERVKGVLSVSASYATSTAKINYDPELIDEAELPKALSQAGYQVRPRSERVAHINDDRSLLRLLTGVSLTAVVMMLYLAFFYPTNLGLVPTGDLEPVRWLAYYTAPRVMIVFTSILIFYVGFPILRGAWIGIRAHTLNMDNLLSIAILAAYGYSIAQVFIGSHDLYFDVAAVIVTVVTVGRYFEKNAKSLATEELSRIISAWNPRVSVMVDKNIEFKTVDELKPGDRIVVSQGEFIPVNGIISHGTGALDESLMTGEPFPVLRHMGEAVLGGTRLVEGEVSITVGDSVESQMDTLARILWRVQSTSGGMLGMADRIARIFVPLVLLLAFIVTAGMLYLGSDPGVALLAGLATLIVSCPCTFGLAVPLTTAVAVSTALKNGIIITSPTAYEDAFDIKTVAIDKTGTLSTGKMHVDEVIGPAEMSGFAAAVERLSVHPIAEAIARLDSVYTATGPVIHPGKGAEAIVEGKRVAVGSSALFQLLGWQIPDQIVAHVDAVDATGGVISYVGKDGEVVGAIITRDHQRPRWEQFISQLKEEYRVVLLTGAEHPGGYESEVDMWHAGVPPEAKAAIIRQLRAEGGVVMVGDGSNDGPALAAANLGVAFGVPTSLAAEAADVIIPGDKLDRIFVALDLLKTARRRIRQNIGWALLYNAIAIPLALSGMLNPLFAALAMASSSLLVVWNSSRSLERAEWRDEVGKADQVGLEGWSRLGASTQLTTSNS